jgi:hypothetical protein
MLSALGPFSRVVLDFSGAREISAAALVAAVAALDALRGTEILVNGLSAEATAACIRGGAPHGDHRARRATFAS